MRKYKEYYFTTGVVEYTARNNYAVIKYYGWVIRNKNGEPLQSSTEQYDSTEDAEYAAQEHIEEMYY